MKKIAQTLPDITFNIYIQIYMTNDLLHYSYVSQF